MSKTYKYSGLTPELYQRLVDEHAALKKTHKKGAYKQYFQKAKQCDEKQARIIYQAFNNVVVERWRMSPRIAESLRGVISDELYNDLQDYLTKNYTRRNATRKAGEKTNAGLPEELFKRFREEVEELRKEHPTDLNRYIREIRGCDQKQADKTRSSLNKCYIEKATLSPRKVVQIEGMLSRRLYCEIADYVFNNYEWSVALDSEVDRIRLEYRNKGALGRNKPSVKRALYTALAMGV